MPLQIGFLTLHKSYFQKIAFRFSVTELIAQRINNNNKNKFKLVEKHIKIINKNLLSDITNLIVNITDDHCALNSEEYNFNIKGSILVKDFYIIS